MTVTPWSVDGYFVPYNIFFSPPIRKEQHIISFSVYPNIFTKIQIRIMFTAGGGSICVSNTGYMVVNIFAFRKESKSFFFLFFFFITVFK